MASSDFVSTRGGAAAVSFLNAVVSGLAPDGGLYVPNDIQTVFDRTDDYSTLASIGMSVLPPFLGESIDDITLEQLLKSGLGFATPLREIEEDIFVLELFHGPTQSFKDVGAGFMGQVLPYCVGDGTEVLVVVATSGDTGGAVANGLHGLPGVQVAILYPKGKVSPLQERQFASVGGNVQAFAVDGAFDDCQGLVKALFAHEGLLADYKLTTANSINLARWLPQSLYYFSIWQQLQQSAVISVPSGNFGNITAGILAWKMGMPVERFIASCNVNDPVPQYLVSGNFVPRPSVATVANAMDVGNPSNFERLQHLFDRDYGAIFGTLRGATYTDAQILETIADCERRTGYLLDPHGACGYRALKEQLQDREKGVFLATAHPAKFAAVYPRMGLGEPIHPVLEQLRDKPLLSVDIPPDLDRLIVGIREAF